jgi:uncharacterized protein YceH (UPF0502 family)
VSVDAVECRVLGCLIEKQLTTPDQYPLSLNALRLAANQSTNRNPVVDYDETEIRAALERLGNQGWTRLTSGPGSRAAKFRHLLDQALQLTEPQLALLAVLLLRGQQTTAELRTRSERLHPFASAELVDDELDSLSERGLVQRLARQPGERGERWTQLLGNGDAIADAAPSVPTSGGHVDLIELERRVARVEQRLDEAGL